MLEAKQREAKVSNLREWLLTSLKGLKQLLAKIETG